MLIIVVAVGAVRFTEVVYIMIGILLIQSIYFISYLSISLRSKNGKAKNHFKN